MHTAAHGSRAGICNEVARYMPITIGTEKTATHRPFGRWAMANTMLAPRKVRVRNSTVKIVNRMRLRQNGVTNICACGIETMMARTAMTTAMMLTMNGVEYRKTTHTHTEKHRMRCGRTQPSCCYCIYAACKVCVRTKVDGAIGRRHRRRHHHVVQLVSIVTSTTVLRFFRARILRPRKMCVCDKSFRRLLMCFCL